MFYVLYGIIQIQQNMYHQIAFLAFIFYKFNFGRGFVPSLAGKAYDVPPDSLRSRLEGGGVPRPICHLFDALASTLECPVCHVVKIS